MLLRLVDEAWGSLPRAPSLATADPWHWSGPGVYLAGVEGGLCCPSSNLCQSPAPDLPVTHQLDMCHLLGALGSWEVVPRPGARPGGDPGQGAWEGRGGVTEGCSGLESAILGLQWKIRATPQLVHCPSADGGKHEVQVLKSQDEDHYILYCEGDMHGQQMRMAKLVGESQCLVAPALVPLLSPWAPCPSPRRSHQDPRTWLPCPDDGFS